MDSKLDENPTGKLVTYKDAARLCGVPLGTVYSWVATRRVPHLRLGKRLVRFDMDELQEWLDARRVAVSVRDRDTWQQP